MKNQILYQIADVLLNDVINNNYNIITFANLSQALNRKYQLNLPPQQIDDYLEELGMICFALDLPLLNAMVVGRNYQPSPKFINLYRQLYKAYNLPPQAMHKNEMDKIINVYDWTRLSTRLKEGVEQGGEVNTSPTADSIPTEEASRSVELEDESTFLENLEKQVKQSMDDSKLVRRERLNERTDLKPKAKQVVKTVYEVNPDVIAEVLDRAGGRCENCMEYAPFHRTSDFKPYLEIHYKEPLEKGGDDSVDNAIAVCPNCHRQLEDQQL